MDTDKLIELDLKHVWHPCSQMKDYEDFKPLAIERASGSYLYTKNGHKIIDAVSSWWCKSLGHTHPEIKAAVIDQMGRFEHIIAANTCSDVLVELSVTLAELCPPLDKVFYADNGSTAVEVAMKMSLQYHAQTGNSQRKLFASLDNGYHGESILTLAAGDCELYSKPYAHILPAVTKLGPMEFTSGIADSGWDRFPDANWTALEAQLDAISETLTAILFEPILQGAGGMKIYSPDLLRRLRKWADANSVHLIADEIMTGFGRTGKMLACEHAGIVPDFIALSKGLTGGFAPMSAVLCSTEKYNAFYDDYFSGRAFMHSNTYSGYALAAAAAIKAIAIYREEKIVEQVASRSKSLVERMEKIASKTGMLANVRGVGFVAAADIVDPSNGKPFSYKERRGYRCFQEAVKLGALLRPLGDTIYFFPPLNTDDSTLDELAAITEEALQKIT